jgi:transposase-like protein
VFDWLCPFFWQDHTKVFTMEMRGKVKRLYSRDKKSLHEIAKTTGLSRNTIRKWVRETDEVDTRGVEQFHSPLS